MVLMVGWPTVTDDAGDHTSGTPWDHAWELALKASIEDQIHSATNPTIKPKDIIDEVKTARGSAASLNARLSVSLNPDGTFINTGEPPIPKTVFFEKDDFFVGSNLAGSGVGELTWVSANGLTAMTGEANHPGIIRLSTGAVINTVANMYHAGPRSDVTATGLNDLSTSRWMENWVVRLNSLTQTKLRFGLADDSLGTDPPNNGFYFEVVNVGAAANWFVVTRSGGVSTSVDTGIVADANWHIFHLNNDASIASFFIDGVAEGLSNTNRPTASLRPFVQIMNTAAADKSADIDYYSLWIILSRDDGLPG